MLKTRMIDYLVMFCFTYTVRVLNGVYLNCLNDAGEICYLQISGIPSPVIYHYDTLYYIGIYSTGECYI